jgi:hypothetical protein
VVPSALVILPLAAVLLSRTCHQWARRCAMIGMVPLLVAIFALIKTLTHRQLTR